MSEPTIVCVLGMHRSGTSLVSRVLNVLGLDLGPKEHLMRPSSANPAGHWESLPIKEINDEILARLGGSWSRPPGLAAGWERTPELAEVRRQARDLIEADFSGSELWGFKDPRVCLTAPFWQRLLGPMRYLVCIRNPIDVAASLEVREVEPIPFEEGAELWLSYMRGALASTAGHPREFVFYEDLMANPEPVVERLARFIGTDEADAAETDASVAIRVAVSEGLWHHRSAVPNVVDAARLPFHVKALYLALRQFVASAEGVGAETVELLADYAADASRRLAKLEAGEVELSRVRESLRDAERRRAALEQRLAERDADLDRIASSRDEEQRLRHELEAELEARGAEVDRLRAAPAEADSVAVPPSAAVHNPHDRVVREVGERVAALVPSGSTVLVAAKGDDALLEIEGSRGLHFPATLDGRYAGYHPAGDTAVIAQLEAQRARGADHLALPATTLWWLDHYQGLRHHLDERHERLVADEYCAIYRLSAGDRGAAADPIGMVKEAVASLRIRSGRDPSILDWRTGLDLADRLPGMLVFSPPADDPTLPYLEGTVDIVVLGARDADRTVEARRIAASAVISVDPSARDRATLEWLADHPGGWGEDVSVTLFPRGDWAAWKATLGAFAESLENGFAGDLTVVGEPETLARAGHRGAAAAVRMRPIEVASGASLATRARAAMERSDRRVHALVTEPAVPLPDWLPSLLPLFSGDRGAGVVGARILSGDGRLEEAGGILDDGRRLRRGEGDSDPDRPEYCFVRRVDFCSPPLLATQREVFERLGGFDERRTAAGEMVVDFSLRAGRIDAPVYYQPEARVVAMGNGGG